MCHPRDIMTELLASGKLDIERVVTHELDWKDFHDGMELTKSGNCGKVVLTFD